MTLRRLRRYLRALVAPGRLEQDLQEEISFHVDREVDALVAAGLPPDEARRRARARFGSRSLAADQVRDVSGASRVTEVMADITFALRQFRRRPFATAVMVTVLALGIGFSTAIFTAVSSFASGPPAGVDRDAARVRIRGIDRSGGAGRAIGREFSYAEHLEHKAQTTVFETVAAWTSTDVVLEMGAEGSFLESGAATFVTDGYFEVLGVRPVLGAGLPVTGAGTGPPAMAAVISHVLWDRFYDRSPAVIGQTLRVNGALVTIAGVAPPRFVGARTGGSAKRVWLPISARAVVQPSAPPLAQGAAVFGAVARLGPGVDWRQATAVVDTIASRFAAPAGSIDATSSERTRAADVVPLLATNYFPPPGAQSEQSGPGAVGRIVGLSVPILVLLITSTSVSALLAGLSLARRREMAVRLAMGANRWRLVRQLLTETAALGLAASVLASVVLYWLLTTFEASMLEAPVTFDWRSGAFAGALALVTGLVFGLSPALHATRMAVADVLKESDVAASRTRLQAGLVVAQIALTQPALLAMGAQLLRLGSDLQQHSATPVASEIVMVRFNTNPRYGALDASRDDALDRVRRRLAALPSVAGAVPQDSFDDYVQVSPHASDRVEGLPGESMDQVPVQSAPEGFFDAMGFTVERGRPFTAADAAAKGPVIVNAALARRLWGESDALGRRLVTEDWGRARNGGVFTVVGVVAGGRQPRMFMPGTVGATGHLLVRTRGPAETALRDIRATALHEAPGHPIVSARTLAAIEVEARQNTTRGITAAGVAGLIGLTLAAIGLYAVVAVAVGQRQREIGIRMALGADQRRITGHFVRRGVSLCLAGAVIGVAFSVVALRALASLEGTEPPSGVLPLAAGVTVFVFAVAICAAWIPARHAATVDPLTVLRMD